MAKKILASHNFGGNEIQNVRAHLLGSDPASPLEGQFWFNSTLGKLKYFDGVDVVVVGAGGTADDAALLGGQSSAYHLSRTNHTGTQLASTISDFNTAVQTNRLDQLTAPTASIAMGSQKLTGLAAGSANGDSLRYEQVVGVYAPLASPTFTGTVTVPNVAIGAGTSAATIGAVSTALGSYLTTSAAASTYLTSATASTTYAPLASPTFTGTPTLPTGTIASTQTAGDSTTKVATTAFVTGAIATNATADRTRANHTGTQTASTISDFNTAVDARVGLVVDGAPGALDTLNELAAALGDDPNFATTVAGQIAAKATKVTGLIGNGVATSVAFAHNLATQWVTVSVYEVATLALVDAEVTLTDTNTVTVGFSTAPAASAYRVVVTG